MAQGKKPRVLIDMTDVMRKAAALLEFDSRKDGLILEGLDNVANRAAKISATEFIVGSSGGSRDPFIDPPNPPPGPLKTRSGDLRRGIKPVKSSKKGNNFTVGLSNAVPYAGAHEFGGSTPPHTIVAANADTLVFVGRDGTLVFRESVNHPGSNIPPRPFLLPALEEANRKFFAPEVTRALVNGVREIFGTGAVGGSSLPSLLGI
jgi:phage gpG-like protein